MHKLSALLREQLDDKNGKIPPIPVQVEINGDRSILIKAKGYGDYYSSDGNGCPILIEQVNGKLRVIIWTDINEQDPTHIIDLSGALESKREKDDTFGCSECKKTFDVEDSVKKGKKEKMYCPECAEKIPQGATPDDCPTCPILGTAACNSCPENPREYS